MAVVTTIELSKQSFDALGLPNCKQYFWCDSRNVLQWIKNKELALDSRIEKILLYSEPESCSYCPTSLNTANVASRPDDVKKLEARKLWFGESEFLKQNKKFPICESSSDSVNRVACLQDNGELFSEEIQLGKVIKSTHLFMF